MPRPFKDPEKKARQFNVRFPPEIHEFLSDKENKSQLIIDAMKKTYKIGKRKRQRKQQ